MSWGGIELIKEAHPMLKPDFSHWTMQPQPQPRSLLELLLVQFDLVKRSSGAPAKKLQAAARPCTSCSSEVGEKGGRLSFDRDDTTIDIPEGALKQTTNITCMCHVTLVQDGGVTDECGDRLMPLSPTFQCGPDGTCFSKSITIRFRHCIRCNAITRKLGKKLKVFTRRNGKEKWTQDESGSVRLDGEWMEIHICHFSDVMVAVDGDDDDLPDIDIRISTLMTRHEDGRLYCPLILSPDNANDHEEAQCQVYRLRGNASTRVSAETHSWPNVSPVTDIHFQVLDADNNAVLQNEVIGNATVCQLAASVHAEDRINLEERTKCKIRLYQLGFDNDLTFTADLEEHLSEQATAMRFSAHDPEEAGS